MQSSDKLPYALMKKTLPPSFNSLDGAEIYICINLLKNSVVGIGSTREEAMEDMRRDYLDSIDRSDLFSVVEKVLNFVEVHVDDTPESKEAFKELDLYMAAILEGKETK